MGVDGHFRDGRRLRFAVIEKSRSPYWQMINAGFQDAAAALSLQVDIWAPEYEDIPAQVESAERQITSGAGGLGLIGSASGAFDATIARARSRGIPVVTFDLDAPTSDRLLFIGTQEPVELGRQAGRLMLEHLGSGDKVAILTGSDHSAGALGKVRGFREVAEAAGVQVAALANDEERVDRAFANARECLQAHPDLKGLYGVYAYHPSALARAVAAVPKADQVTVIGFDMLPETVACIESGAVAACVWYQEYYFGFHTAAALYNLARLGVAPGLTLFGMNPEDVHGNVRRLPTVVFRKETIGQFRQWAEERRIYERIGRTGGM